MPVLLQIVLPAPPRTPPRPEPDPDVTYRCAAARPVCPVCAVNYATEQGPHRCPHCGAPVETPAIGECLETGTIEVRDRADGFHGLLCQEHAGAVLKFVDGCKLLVTARSLEDLLEARMELLFKFPPHRVCQCPVGTSPGPNEFGDIHCDGCGLLMLAATMGQVSDELVALRDRQEEQPHMG